MGVQTIAGYRTKARTINRRKRGLGIETNADSMKKATSKPLTEEQKADLAALEILPDSEIDTSDIPEVVNWPDAQRGLPSSPDKELRTGQTLARDPRAGTWPPGFTASREQIYDEFGRLTSGPQDDPETRTEYRGP